MNARFIKLMRVQVEGYDPHTTTATVDLLLNAETVVTLMSDDGAELAVVTLADGRRAFVTPEQAEAIEALVLTEGRRA